MLSKARLYSQPRPTYNSQDLIWSPLRPSPCLVLEGFREICPAGPGYHYSASDLRYNTRPLNQDPPRVTFNQPRAPPATPRPPTGELEPGLGVCVEGCHFPGAA